MASRNGSHRSQAEHDEVLRVRHEIRTAERHHYAPVIAGPPLRRACPKCGLSKSAFRTSSEFADHVTICP